MPPQLRTFLVLVLAGCAVAILLMMLTVQPYRLLRSHQIETTTVWSENEVASRHIILIESSCAFREHESTVPRALHGRQLCAVESAARNNPNWHVHLFITCPIRLWSSMPHNVYIRQITASGFLKGTPLEGWDAIKNSSYPVAHAADIMRLVALWKMGGIYLDLDCIVLRSLEELPDNFAGQELPGIVANGVIGFSHEGWGHGFVTELLVTVKREFRGDLWSENGPMLITRVLKRIGCNLTEITSSSAHQCFDMMILPPAAFYPLYADADMWIFNKSYTSKFMAALRGSFLYHAWNALTSEMQVDLRSDQPYAVLAGNVCPSTVLGSKLTRNKF